MSNETMSYWIGFVFGAAAVACAVIIALAVGADQPLLSPEASPLFMAPSVTETATPSATPTTTVYNSSWMGEASYYARAGCIGCSPSLLMANGQPLDDTALTVAFNKAKLGSKLLITNMDTGLQTQATVTDTGGFERHGRIVDLTLATKDAIACADLCRVRVDLL